MNFADAEARTDWLAERPAQDLPDPSECIDTPPPRIPNTHLCIAAWVTHSPTEYAACDFCQGRLPLCRWNNGRERCVHGRFLDDPETQWHPIAGRHYCNVYQERRSV